MKKGERKTCVYLFIQECYFQRKRQSQKDRKNTTK